MSLRNALNVREFGRVGDPGAPVFVFAHGYGCDQTLWHGVARLLPEARCILFDWPGAGGAQSHAYDPQRHQALQGYADDLLVLLDELSLSDPVYVGHSAAASIGALAAARAPGLFGQLAMVAPSPCYRNDPPDYQGGFETAQLHEIVCGLAEGQAAWAQAVAPLAMGYPERPALAHALAEQFCRMDPAVALRWACATFLGDVRPVVAELSVPTLVMQCRDDALAPPAVGEWLLRRLRRGRLLRLQARGHCPHVSEPAEIAQALREHGRWRGED